MKRIAAIEEAEESSFAKELAELRVRIYQMDTSRKEDLIPPTSIIAVSKPETWPDSGGNQLHARRRFRQKLQQ